MNILWLTWKDRKNPQSGGAEVINEGLATKLAIEGHQVKFLVAGFKKGKESERKLGFEIIRVGNRFTLYWEAYRYFQKHLQKWPDLIIEEINTVPFFTQFYTTRKKILIIYQLCREVWFYQFPFPFSVLGYLLELIYLRLLNGNKVLTESESTMRELVKFGFKPENISIFPIGIPSLKPVSLTKFSKFTLLSCGSIRSMKRTQDQIKAFEIAKLKIPDLRLVIIGDSNNSYGQKTLGIIKSSRCKKDIMYLGKIGVKEKYKLMARCQLLLVTSVKEGWCLVVTEANSQRTPAIVYNVDGLRDSVKSGKTGLLCKKNNPEELAKNIIRLYQNKILFKKLQKNAWNFSKSFSLEKSYLEFKKNANIA